MAIPDPPPHPTHYRILLSDPEGYDTVQGYEEVEWTLPVSGETLPNGWRQFDIPLRDAVRQTWGSDGWTFRGLSSIQLRGNLAISPIECYESAAPTAR